ncbi:MAG: RNA methyltransferase [Bacteroidales bacterium]|nr:RNA methyltransferase [Bacteroidales bacterium]
MYIDQLSSFKNPKIKDLILLGEKSRERREKGLFTVEGKREISNALNAGFECEEIFFCSEIFDEANLTDIKASRYYSVNKELYSKVAYRDGTEGIIAVMRQRELILSGFKPGNNPLVLVLESVEKPGNLGAVIRTADAANADAVIICDPQTDIYNPNVIRSSIGGIFSRNVFACTSQQAYEWIVANNIKIYTAELQAAEWYHKTDLSGPMALVLGTESEGLTTYWRERAHHRIKIPMSGKLDSLNVSVSAAVICFEALRQRGFKNT